MTPRDIAIILVNTKSWLENDEGCDTAFCEYMSGKDYGEPETIEAWEFFHAGWMAHAL